MLLSEKIDVATSCFLNPMCIMQVIICFKLKDILPMVKKKYLLHLTLQSP